MARNRKEYINEEYVDNLLHRLPRAEIAPGDLLRIRKSLSAVTRNTGGSDIMTLEEVSEYLRISQHELELILPDLPLFELAGRLRLRRHRLDEWIGKREKEYVQANVRSAIQQELTVINNKEVVA